MLAGMPDGAPATAASAAAAAPAAAQSTENRFQRLFEAGAFNADGKPEAQPSGEPARSETATPAGAEAAREGPAQAAEEGPEYANVEDYLQKAGIERESFLTLPIRVKVDGKDLDVPLSDVVKNYGLEKHFQAKSVAFAEQQRAWEATQAQARAALEQQLTQAQALGNLAHQQLLGQYQSIDWNKLRADDPAQWAVLNTEFNQRAGAIQQHLAAVEAQRQQMAQAQQLQTLQALPAERSRMLDARPEWRDEAKFQAARGEMRSYAQKLGFTDAELAGVFDHRYVLALHDAARYAALQAASPEAVKRVRAAPQVAAPGARTQRDPNVTALQQARERLRKNPRSQEAQLGVFELLAR